MEEINLHPNLLKPYIRSALPTTVEVEEPEVLGPWYRGLGDSLREGTLVDFILFRICMGTDVKRTSEEILEGRTEGISHILYAALSESLRWSYEGNDNQAVQLGYSLLPSLIKEDQHDLDSAIGQCGFSNQEVEEIFKNFADNELGGKKLKLSWGGYIVKNDSGYELCK